jgi:predicted MFS family arabinose efflux permease
LFPGFYPKFIIYIQIPRRKNNGPFHEQKGKYPDFLYYPVYILFTFMRYLLSCKAYPLEGKGEKRMTNGKQSSKKLILTGLIMGLLLSSLDQTITTTAMPTVVKELGGLSLYSWVFSIYMLTSTTSMPIYGKLADFYGRKRMYLIGMVLFLIGSALCGLATDMTQLILFRGIQGLGAGALMTIAMTIAADLYTPEKRGGGFQVLFGAVLGLSSMIGPTIGGTFLRMRTC